MPTVSAGRRQAAAVEPSQPDGALNMGGLDDKLGFRLRFAERRIFREIGDSFQAFGVSPLLYSILTLLAMNPGCRQAELGAALGVHQPNLVEKIDTLVSRGLALRTPDPDDRRANTLRLTDAGIEFLVELDRIDDEVTSRIVERIGADDYATLVELLRKLA
jgi:DNA-binding MarR family transcriptional regulator